MDLNGIDCCRTLGLNPYLGMSLVSAMKSALVTGANRGIGLELTRQLLESGFNVHATFRTDEGGLAAITDPNLSIHKMDVRDKDGIKRVIDSINSLDLLINNAGVAGKNTTVVDYPLDEWKKVIDLNLNAVFYCCKAVTPYMIKNNYGRIVNIASIAGKEGNPNASAYSTSKAGVIGLTKSLGKELALKNIAVNCVTPAAAKTRIFDQMTEEHINYMLSKIPRNKFAKVDELASLVAWLSSEENSFSTAAVFDLSGGRATY